MTALKCGSPRINGTNLDFWLWHYGIPSMPNTTAMADLPDTGGTLDLATGLRYWTLESIVPEQRRCMA
jgi:hypothetical protein